MSGILPTWADQLSAALKNDSKVAKMIENYPVISDFVQMAVKSMERLPIYPDSSEDVIKEELQKIKKVPEHDTAYETVRDYEVEKDLKKTAHKKGLSQSEYKDFVLEYFSNEKKKEEKLLRTLSDHGFKKEDYEKAKQEYEKEAGSIKEKAPKIFESLMGNSDVILSRMIGRSSNHADNNTVNTEKHVVNPSGFGGFENKEKQQGTGNIALAGIDSIIEKEL